TRKYHGVEAVSVGGGLHFARLGATLLVSNNRGALERGLDLALGRAKNSVADLSGPGKARALLPKAPLAHAWVSLKPAHDSPQGKALYKSPRDDFNVTLAFGSVVDTLGRSPFVAVGLCEEKDGLLLTVRMPRGREGMGNDRLLHLPPSGQPGTRPLLLPKSVFYTQSFYLDLASFWNDRAKHL